MDLFRPNFVAPMVGYLCHENCPVTGEVLEAAGGYFGKYQWQRGKGKVFTDPDKITIEDIENNWQKITDMSNSTSPISMQNHSLLLIDQLKGIDDELEQSSKINNDNENICFELTYNDAILYALSGNDLFYH